MYSFAILSRIWPDDLTISQFRTLNDFDPTQNYQRPRVLEIPFFICQEILTLFHKGLSIKVVRSQREGFV